MRALHVLTVILEAFVTCSLTQSTPPCTILKHTHLGALGDRLFTRWLLWIKPVGSVAQCGELCQADSVCVSYQVSVASGICRGHGVTFSTEFSHSSTQGYKFYQTERGTGHIGSTCQIDGDCVISSSVCINNECTCQPGLSFSVSQQLCLTSCTSYGSSFTEIRGYFIPHNNQATFLDVSKQQCKDQCIAAKSFACRSADYRTSDGRCDLSDKTLQEVAPFIENNITVITHFARDCET